MGFLRLAFPLAIALALGTLAPATPAEAKRAHTIRIKFPAFSVPPNSDREVCTFVRLPADQAYNVSGQSIINVGVRSNFVSHHFLMYAYTGNAMDGFANLLSPKIVDSKACLDFGPTDSTQRYLIGGSQLPKFKAQLPVGLALQVPVNSDSQGKAIGIILNSHWINSDLKRAHTAAVKIRLTATRPHTVKRFLQPIFEVLANSGIDVPPGQVSTAAKGSWSPGGLDLSGFGGAVPPKGAACVTQLTSHMHKRGRLFTVNFHAASGAVQTVFETGSYSDPIPVNYIPPAQPPSWSTGSRLALLVKPGDSITYQCTHDNGVNTVQKMGCEEDATGEFGGHPGLSVLQSLAAHRGYTGGAAKRCAADSDCPATDPKYPGRTFTGRCVPANLVFGFTSDDDMCILPGSYYDVNANAPAGADPCDLSLMQPVLN